MTNIILLLAATTTALIAGLFYAYSCSVNSGLGRLPDRDYMAAMQSINRAIQNLLFFTSFIGTLILLPLSAYLHYQSPLQGKFLLLLIAAAVYAVGVFGVTIFGNVPLNNALANFNLQIASVNEIANQRLKFERPWLLLHNIRTVCSVVCLVLTLVDVSINSSST